jgi:hypothetical protein
MHADLAAGARHFDEVLDRSVRVVRVLADTDAALRHVRGVAATDGVEAEVDGTGLLTGLRIDDAAVQLPPQRIGELIVTTAAAAAIDAARRRGELLDDLVRALGT